MKLLRNQSERAVERWSADCAASEGMRKINRIFSTMLQLQEPELSPAAEGQEEAYSMKLESGNNN